MPRMKITNAIVINLRRDSGVIGFLPPGMSFDRPVFSFSGVVTSTNLEVNCDNQFGPVHNSKLVSVMTYEYQAIKGK